jgi:pimeloyl-ACP methyl ester carboxylesterase
MRVVYLHGFASSPQSNKAQFFKRRFHEQGVLFEAPQLDEGNFERLTITGQLAVVEKAVAGAPAVLVGSSLGGYLAALYAARHPGEVERMVLMAPAFQFASRWRARFRPEDLAVWKQQGSAPFFHYGSRTEQRLGYSFVEDADQYEEAPDFRQPALIMHGSEDPVVPAAISLEFAVRRPNVRVQLFPSGHELTDVLDGLWEEASKFLDLRRDAKKMMPASK